MSGDSLAEVEQKRPDEHRGWYLPPEPRLGLCRFVHRGDLRRPSPATSGQRDDAVEWFGVGVAVRLAERRTTGAPARRHRREVGKLALVARERLELQLDRLGDVHDEVVILPLPLDDVDLEDLVRLVLGQELREGQVIPREGVEVARGG